MIEALKYKMNVWGHWLGLKILQLLGFRGFNHAQIFRHLVAVLRWAKAFGDPVLRSFFRPPLGFLAWFGQPKGGAV